MPKKKSERRKLISELDKVCAHIIKERAGHRCQRCGRSGCKLDWHHVFGRNLSVRWDLKATVCLCFRCHRLGFHSPSSADQEDSINWAKMYLGETVYDDLKAVSRSTVKWGVVYLRELLEKLKKET